MALFFLSLPCDFPCSSPPSPFLLISKPSDCREMVNKGFGFFHFLGECTRARFAGHLKMGTQSLLEEPLPPLLRKMLSGRGLVALALLPSLVIIWADQIRWKSTIVSKALMAEGICFQSSLREQSHRPHQNALQCLSEVKINCVRENQTCFDVLFLFPAPFQCIVLNFIFSPTISLSS